MLNRSKSDLRCATNSKARPRRPRGPLRLFCGMVVIFMLPFAAGCSPELLVGGAIVGSVLYAHANKDNFPPRREPTLQGSRIYRSAGYVGPVYTASRPPAQRTEPQPESRTVTGSPVMEGARAYRELRWEDAVSILDRAVNTGTCTEPELGQAHILLGAIAYQQGDAKTARRHFLEAHRHDPQLQPSPDLFPPCLVDFYRDVSGP